MSINILPLKRKRVQVPTLTLASETFTHKWLIPVERVGSLVAKVADLLEHLLNEESDESEPESSEEEQSDEEGEEDSSPNTNNCRESCA